MNIDSIIMAEYYVVAHAVDRHTVLMIFTALCGAVCVGKINHLKVEFNRFRGWRGGPCIRKGF